MATAGQMTPRWLHCNGSKKNLKTKLIQDHFAVMVRHVNTKNEHKRFYALIYQKT